MGVVGVTCLVKLRSRLRVIRVCLYENCYVFSSVSTWCQHLGPCESYLRRLLMHIWFVVKIIISEVHVFQTSTQIKIWKVLFVQEESHKKSWLLFAKSHVGDRMMCFGQMRPNLNLLASLINATSGGKPPHIILNTTVQLGERWIRQQHALSAGKLIQISRKKSSNPRRQSVAAKIFHTFTFLWSPDLQGTDHIWKAHFSDLNQRNKVNNFCLSILYPLVVTWQNVNKWKEYVLVQSSALLKMNTHNLLQHTHTHTHHSTGCQPNREIITQHQTCAKINACNLQEVVVCFTDINHKLVVQLLKKANHWCLFLKWLLC